MTDDHDDPSTVPASPSELRGDLRRLGLVAGVALAALAVLALAWIATPTNAPSAATTALGIGAATVLSLAVLAIGAAHRRTHEQLTAHAELFEAGRVQTPESDGADAFGADVEGRLGEIEDRLSQVEAMQNEHLVELIDATDPPHASDTATASASDTAAAKR